MNSQIHSYFAFPEKKGSLVRVQPAPQNLIKIGAVAQLVEIKVYTVNWFLSLNFRDVVQLVEYVLWEHVVRRSSRRIPTKLIKFI